MTVRHAYKILKQHADWREGITSEQVSPQELSRALEILLVYLDNKINNSNHANL
jgi:hypothetical protein